MSPREFTGQCVVPAQGEHMTAANTDKGFARSRNVSEPHGLAVGDFLISSNGLPTLLCLKQVQGTYRRCSKVASVPGGDCGAAAQPI